MIHIWAWWQFDHFHSATFEKGCLQTCEDILWRTFLLPRSGSRTGEQNGRSSESRTRCCIPRLRWCLHTPYHLWAASPPSRTPGRPMDTQVDFHNPVIISSGIGGNFLGPVMIPFKLVTAELSCDLSLPGAARPVDDDENDLRRSLHSSHVFQAWASWLRALGRETSLAAAASPARAGVSMGEEEEEDTLLLNRTRLPARGSTIGRCTTW